MANTSFSPKMTCAKSFIHGGILPLRVRATDGECHSDGY